MANSPWAQAYAAGGLSMVAMFSLVYAAALGGLTLLFRRAEGALKAGIAVIAIWIGFVFHRNDILVEVVYLKHVIYIFCTSLVVAWFTGCGTVGQAYLSVRADWLRAPQTIPRRRSAGIGRIAFAIGSPVVEPVQFTDGGCSVGKPPLLLQLEDEHLPERSNGRELASSRRASHVSTSAFARVRHSPAALDRVVQSSSDRICSVHIPAPATLRPVQCRSKCKDAIRCITSARPADLVSNPPDRPQNSPASFLPAFQVTDLSM